MNIGNGKEQPIFATPRKKKEGGGKESERLKNGELDCFGFQYRKPPSRARDVILWPEEVGPCYLPFCLFSLFVFPSTEVVWSSPVTPSVLSGRTFPQRLSIPPLSGSLFSIGLKTKKKKFPFTGWYVSKFPSLSLSRTFVLVRRCEGGGCLGFVTDRESTQHSTFIYFVSLFSGMFSFTLQKLFVFFFPSSFHNVVGTP